MNPATYGQYRWVDRPGDEARVNLSMDLGFAGRQDEGLAAVQEATAIRRQLAKDGFVT
ncbi:hypothetical protein [Streptomyces sp. IGB124]|uniref:hypothetical protein n=1 Tax=Streptomyces sp. IGB124 TaxID=1519485 RepID=UPI000B28C345|nr:hypothetical protein [Streptomyces sp. IGB124]